MLRPPDLARPFPGVTLSGVDFGGSTWRVNETEPHAEQAAARPAGAAELADEQGLLFDDDVSPLPDDVGYRGPTACNAAGITYRQLDYWARTGLVEPTVRGATGSGTQRLYCFRDILLLKVIKRLLDAGISLQQIRTAVAPPARARHRRPDPRHPDERRRQRLRVHQQRRGHRPAPGRPGRLRHRHRRRLARDRGLAGRAAERAHRRGRDRRRRRRRARRPPRGPQDRLTRTARPPTAVTLVVAGRSSVRGRFGLLTIPRGRVRPVHDRSGAPKGQLLPGTSQAPGPRGQALWSDHRRP